MLRHVCGLVTRPQGRDRVRRDGGGARAAALAAAALAAAALLAAAGCRGRGGRYVDAERRFMLQTPAGWTVRQFSGDPCLFVLGPGGPGPGQPSVNVVVATVGPLATLEETVTAARAAAGRLQGYEPLEEGPRTLSGGRRGWAAAFRHQALGPSVTVRQLFVVAGGRAYTVTAAARTADFAAREAEFQTCLDSFQAGW